MRVTGRLGGFFVSVVMTAGVSIISIPIIVRGAGAEAWSALAVGQTVGILVGIFTSIGWPALGPSMAAQASGRDLSVTYRASLVSRACTLPVTMPIAGVLSWNLVGENRLAATVTAVAFVLNSLTSGWFFVGLRQPGSLFGLDTLPRAVGTLAGALLILAGAPLAVFPACQLASFLAILVVSSVLVRIRYGRPDRRMDRRELLRIYRVQLPALSTMAFSAAYLYTPLLVVTSLAPSQAGVYAMADRLKQQATVAVSPVSQTLQGWVPSGGRTRVKKRATRAALVATAAGLAAATMFALLAPWCSALLSDGQLNIGYAVSLPLGLALGLNVMSTCIGLACLFPLNMSASVSNSAICGFGVCLVVFPVFTSLLGEVGMAWGVALVQFCVVLYQVWYLHLAVSGHGGRHFR